MEIATLTEKKDKIERFAHSNKLIEARYSLSLQEQRLILMMVAMISPSDEAFKEYEINIREFAEFLNIKGDSVIGSVKKAAKNLVEKSITIIDQEKTLYASWISSAEFPEGKSYVSLCFDPKLKPYLLKLKEQYTLLENKYLTQLRSAYSIRIYMLLKQYVKFGKRSFRISALREILGIKEEEYKRYYDFSVNVINKAVIEINNKTDLLISALPSKKEGKSVLEITFEIREKNEESGIIDGIENEVFGTENVNNEESGTKEKVKKKSAFQIPSDAELKEFWLKNNFCSDWEEFRDHFNSNGWKVSGKTPMVDWAAAGRNWEKKFRKYNPTAKPNIISKESENIKVLKQKLQKEFLNNQLDYDLYFAGNDITEQNDGFMMKCDQKTKTTLETKFKSVLEKFKIQLTTE